MTCLEHFCGPQEMCSVQDGQRGCHPQGHKMCSVGVYTYRTFDGLGFQYEGACGLVLSTIASGTDMQNFMISTQKVPNGPQGDGFTNILKFESNGTDVSVTVGDISTVQVGCQLFSYVN